MTPSTHTPARNANIDMIRTVAIVAVVCIHMDVFGYTPRLSCLSDILLTAVMMMFVICSGHFIFPLRGSARDFLLRRMRALLPGYILAAVFYSWGQVFLAGDIVYSVGHRMEWMWLVSPVGFLWFVTMMIGLYLFVPFLSPWTAQASRRSVDVFLLLCLVAGSIPLAGVFTHIPSVCETTIGPFAGFLGLAVAGFWLKRWPYEGWSTLRRTVFWTLVTGALVMSIISVPSAVRNGFNKELASQSGANVALIAVGVYVLLRQISINGRAATAVFHSCGRATYGIYLIHIAICSYLLPAVFPALPPWANAIITLTASYALTVALTRLWHLCTVPFTKPAKTRP